MKNKLLALPYVLWMTLFTIIPLGIVLYFAFTDQSTETFSFSNILQMKDYGEVFLHSVALAAVAALICLIIGYPVAYFISTCKPSVQNFLYLMVMLPMCMSFLLRTLAWVALLANNGIINSFLTQIGLGALPLTGNNCAVVLGMVYNYLPYMIMPLYSVMVKIDPRLIEAAEDLGCTSMTTFTRVVLPLSVPGIISGFTMVFVPAISTFYISKQLGGTSTVLIGDVVETQFKSAYNPNLGAAISLVLMIIVFICVGIMGKFDKSDDEEVRL